MDKAVICSTHSVQQSGPLSSVTNYENMIYAPCRYLIEHLSFILYIFVSFIPIFLSFRLTLKFVKFQKFFIII